METSKLGLPESEFKNRIERVRNRLAEEGLEALCLFSSTNIEWVSGFHHLQTERPVCLAVTQNEVRITVPRLELDRAESDEFGLIEKTHHYYDYPGGDGEYYEHPKTTPEDAIKDMIDVLEVSEVGADSNGAPGHWGYSGPSLDELAEIEVETVGWIDEWRKEKTENEIELMKESAKWGNLAHRKLHEHASPGRHELWVGQKASLDASMEMLDTLGGRYESHLRGQLPVFAGLLSGENTALPHGLTENRRLEEGDVIITGAGANVGGYLSELERTMFVGEPDDEDKHYFEIMLEAQTIGIEACGPGVECSYVDQEVHDYLKEQGVVEYAQHHTGHNIGMEGHEADFLDRGSDKVMKEGHLYTIEPGIYVPGKAGYRHSDTVVITEDGVETITYYPRELEENIIRTE